MSWSSVFNSVISNATGIRFNWHPQPQIIRNADQLHKVITNGISTVTSICRSHLRASYSSTRQSQSFGAHQMPQPFIFPASLGAHMVFHSWRWWIVPQLNSSSTLTTDLAVRSGSSGRAVRAGELLVPRTTPIVSCQPRLHAPFQPRALMPIWGMVHRVS